MDAVHLGSPSAPVPPAPTRAVGAVEAPSAPAVRPSVVGPSAGSTPPAGAGPAGVGTPTPPLPVSLQRQQLRPPEPPLMTTEQMRTLLDAVVTGTGQRVL